MNIFKTPEKINFNAETSKDQLYLLFYNTDDNDLSKLFFILRNMNLSDSLITDLFYRKQSLTVNLSLASMSTNKRLLLAFYLHLYAKLKTRNLITDIKLAKIRELLGLNSNFADAADQYIKTIDTNFLLRDGTPLEAIVEQNVTLVNIAQDFIIQLNKSCNYTVKKSLRGLSSTEYEHEFDRKALETLKKTAGLDTVVRKFNQYGVERFIKISYTGSNIKVTQKNLPVIYNALVTACGILDINHVPELYMETGFLNAFTAGVEKPIVVLTTSCVDLLNYDELLFVLGHELGHIKSQHVLYHQIGQALPYIGELIGSVTLGIGSLVSTALQIALFNWHRKSEFTADRAGLLCCQNIDAAVSAMMKIAGMPPNYYDMINPQDFIEQAKEFEGFDENGLDKIAKLLFSMNQTHPWTVLRGAELQKWIQSGEFTSIINRYNLNSLKIAF